jgi:hypothetical protein
VSIKPRCSTPLRQPNYVLDETTASVNSFLLSLVSSHDFIGNRFLGRRLTVVKAVIAEYRKIRDLQNAVK